MSETSLVIMAAGMGSRYGGIKQLEPVGPGGEIIMDYSIYDALKAGFNKIVFIIRKDLEKDFKEIIGNRIEKLVNVEYVFQELEDLPDGFTVPEGRTKPWGTGQAVLCCKDVIREPFAVINADDYYGKEAIGKIYQFLNDSKHKENQYCMAGFVLGNTLSENGTVTRGVCKVDDRGILASIAETHNIKSDGITAVAKDSEGKENHIALDSAVSMNMWGFKTGLFGALKKGFLNFLTSLNGKELKGEYLLPEAVGDMIRSKEAEVYVLKTFDRWFGVTYKEDKETVVRSFRALIDQGIYPEKLFP